MKKGVFLFIMSCISLIGLSQQPLSVGQKQVNIGTGFSGYGIPVFIGLDYCFKSNLTVGGEVSFRNYRYSNKFIDYNQNVIGLGLNVNYHFNELFALPSEWNIYGGGTVGYFIWSDSGKFPGGRTSGLGLGIQVGVRYFFTQKFGLLLEANGGFSTSAGKIGITIKL